MKEPHTEGVAIHCDPESCGGVRKGVTEALTGVRAGEVSSREIMTSECRRGSGPGRQHGPVRHRGVPGRLRAVQDPVHVRKSPCARTGRSLRPPESDGDSGRIGEAEP